MWTNKRQIEWPAIPLCFWNQKLKSMIKSIIKSTKQIEMIQWRTSVNSAYRLKPYESSLTLNAILFTLFPEQSITLRSATNSRKRNYRHFSSLKLKTSGKYCRPWPIKRTRKKFEFLEEDQCASDLNESSEAIDLSLSSSLSSEKATGDLCLLLSFL